MKIVKGLRKLLHPPEFMAWINCGLDSCGLDGDENRQGFEEFIKSSRTNGLDQLWLGWRMKIVKGLRNLLHPPGLMAWILWLGWGIKVT